MTNRQNDEFEQAMVEAEGEGIAATQEAAQGQDEMTDKIDNQLTVVVKESGLQPNKVDSLLQSFAGYFNQAKQLAEESRDIVVTDESQTDLMAKAREFRLKLKVVRVEVEKTRIELKEQSLRENKAIDGISNVIKALIIPVEEYLEIQEKYAEIKELERVEKYNSERIINLSAYVDDVSFYNLKDMSDEAFNNLLEQSKIAYNTKVALQKKVEEDRIETEKKEKEEHLRIKAENQKLKEEAEIRERKIEIERKVAEEKFATEQKLKEEAEAKLKAEKETQEKKEREIREIEEAKKKAEEEAKRKSLLAPDKEKLIEFAGTIDKIQAPAVANNDAGIIINEALKKLGEVSNLIRERAKLL